MKKKIENIWCVILLVGLSGCSSVPFFKDSAKVNDSGRPAGDSEGVPGYLVGPEMIDFVKRKDQSGLIHGRNGAVVPGDEATLETLNVAVLLNPEDKSFEEIASSDEFTVNAVAEVDNEGGFSLDVKEFPQVGLVLIVLTDESLSNPDGILIPEQIKISSSGNTSNATVIKAETIQNNTILQELDAPLSLQHAARSNQLDRAPDASWNSVDNAQSYEISIVNGENVILAWQDLAQELSYESEIGIELANGKKYSYRVRAIDQDGFTGPTTTSTGWQLLKCPDNFVKVYGEETNELGGAPYDRGTATALDSQGSSSTIRREISDFCVMKYEAKVVGESNGAIGVVGQDVTESRASGTPWVNISRDEARTVCSSLGQNYALLNNAQWQSIGRNIEASGNFITTGATSDHAFNRGHTDGTQALEASDNDAHGCFGLGPANTYNSSSVSVTCDGSLHLNKRTHALSSGEVLWDFSGNVAEWVFDDINQSYGSSGFFSDGGPYNNDVARYQKFWGPGSSYSLQTGFAKGGLGLFNDNNSGTQKGVFRGGAYSNSNNAGIYRANVNNTPDFDSIGLGFRCAFAP